MQRDKDVAVEKEEVRTDAAVGTDVVPDSAFHRGTQASHTDDKDEGIVLERGIQGRGHSDSACVGRQQDVTCVDVYGQYLSGIAGERLLGSVCARFATLEHLSVHKCSIPSVGLHGIAVALGAGRLKTLNLSACGLEDARAKQVSAGLMGNTSLRVLLIAANHLTHTGLLSLTLALKAHPCIATLDVSFNPFGDGGATHIAGLLAGGTGSLREVRADGCEISNKGAESLLSVINHGPCLVERLALSQNSITHLGLASCLPLMASPSLRVLDLSHNALRHAGASCRARGAFRIGCRVH